MIVQCPECTTKYNLDESKIGHDGTKVRCSRCKNIFTVFRPAAVEPAEPVAPPMETPRSDAGDSFEDDFAAMFEEREPEASASGGAGSFEDELGKSAAPSRPSKESKVTPDTDGSLEDDLSAMLEAKMAKAVPNRNVDEEMLADLEGAFQQPLLGDPDRDAGSGGDAASKKGGKSSRLFLILGLVIVLLACAGAGVYFLRPAFLGLGPEVPSPPAASGSAPRAGAAQIALENVRQYFVPNEKEGQLFIIEGKAVNRFPEARELIRLKASLFDRQGNEVSSKEFMCGNVVSLYQLQVSSKEDIDAALSAKVGILTNNTNIQPGASVPFMAVFYQAPESVEEFGLEVIQSSLPQQ
jgi:predicted Zn finger-like uncharacterized protein